MMMLVRCSFLFVVSLFLSACSLKDSVIQTVCSQNEVGNYIIKWEVSPESDGEVKIYVSDSPDEFDFTSPVGSYPISNGVATYVPRDNSKRKFFYLTFNGKNPQIVSSRFVKMDKIQNLRDLGGYQSGKQHIRWGKVFRSGSIHSFSEWDSIRLSNIQVKTIIDLRPVRYIDNNPIRYDAANIITIPVSLGNQLDLDWRIRKNRIKMGDGLLYMQDLYLQFVEEDKEQFSKALKLFVDKENYPILCCSVLGKDQAGFLAALLLSILDVPNETILSDYVASNEYIDPMRFLGRVEHLNQDTQEAVTVILSARESFLNLAFEKIKKDYGSVREYLHDGLNLSDEEQARIREILLYSYPQK